MREFVEVILERDLYLTEPSPRDISGQVCRKLHKSKFRSVISARGMLQISINWEGF